MAELIKGELSGIEFTDDPESASHGDNLPPIPRAEPSEEAPYGRKADGTPRKKPGRKSGSGRSKARVSKAELERQLADRLGQVLIPIGFVNPLAGAVIDDQVDKTANGLVVLMGDSPRFQRWIAQSLKAEAIWNVLALPMGIVVAFQVDSGNLHPAHFICNRFGIPEKFDRLVAGGWRPRGWTVETPEDVSNGHHGAEPRTGLFGGMEDANSEGLSDSQ